MVFIVFLSLQALLMSAYVFGDESSESEEINAEDMKISLCGEKNAEVSNIIVGCFDEMFLNGYSSDIIQCYEGINGEINGQVMRDWICEHTIDELTKADECSDDVVIAEKGEEYLAESIDVFEECVESKVPNDRKRK